MTTPPPVALPVPNLPAPLPSLAPSRRSTLYARVVGVNAAILFAATLMLAATPATVSRPVAHGEWMVLAVGLVVLVVANALLLRISFRGLTGLVRQMETLDVLQPRERLPAMGGVETRTLIAGFNAMLDRLEAERRASTRRTVSGLEAERQRIGRELHDEIGQRLTGILLQLERIHDDAPTALRARVEGVQEETRATMDEVGALAHQVRPGVLNDLGLRSGLDALADSFRQHGAARIDAVLPHRLPALAAEAELTIYRIAQEALTNAVRHAEASRVVLALEVSGEQLELTVSDDGRGLAGDGGEGQGLRGMRERAMLVGGRLRLDRPGPRGLRVRLTVPEADLAG